MASSNWSRISHKSQITCHKLRIKNNETYQVDEDSHAALPKKSCPLAASFDRQAPDHLGMELKTEWPSQVRIWALSEDKVLQTVYSGRQRLERGCAIGVAVTS